MDIQKIWQMVNDIMTCMEMKDLESCFGTIEVEQILEMGVIDAFNRYKKWKGQEATQKAFSRGDVVMIDGSYYMIIGFWGDSRTGIDAITPDGRIEYIPKAELEDLNMRLNLDIAPVNGIVSFLYQLQKSYDVRKVGKNEKAE